MQKKKKVIYKLLSDAFSDIDINKGIEVLKSKQITMSKHTENFEKNFAKCVGSKFALMVNSGSSANLIALFTSINPMHKKPLKRGDEVIIPAICWSTSLWPIIQAGLKPVFVDVDMDTLNISVEELNNKITKKTKAIMCVHILGLSSDMWAIKRICTERKLILFEDTCESLGSRFNNKDLGTFGNYGTYSFYYSHQITSGEGGMVVFNDKISYNIGKSLRSHGWSRGTSFHNEYAKKYKNLNNKFLFINSGFNLRPTDVQAAIANNQLKRLNKFKFIRNQNRNKIIASIKNSKNWKNQFNFINPKKNISPSWFGLPILLNEKYKNKLEKFLKFLDFNGIENRPILSGNFTNQPANKLYKLLNKKNTFPNADLIQKTGFFLGLHTKKISNIETKYLSEKLLEIDKI